MPWVTKLLGVNAGLQGQVLQGRGRYFTIYCTRMATCDLLSTGGRRARLTLLYGCVIQYPATDIGVQITTTLTCPQPLSRRKASAQLISHMCHLLIPTPPTATQD